MKRMPVYSMLSSHSYTHNTQMQGVKSVAPVHLQQSSIALHTSSWVGTEYLNLHLLLSLPEVKLAACVRVTKSDSTSTF